MTKFQKYIEENAPQDVINLWEAVKDFLPEPTSAGRYESNSEITWDDGNYHLSIDRDEDGLCWIFRDRENNTMVGGEPATEQELCSAIKEYAKYFVREMIKNEK